MSPQTVQTFAGHASLQVAMDPYGHLFPSEDHEQWITSLRNYSCRTLSEHPPSPCAFHVPTISGHALGQRRIGLNLKDIPKQRWQSQLLQPVLHQTAAPAEGIWLRGLATAAILDSRPS